jgi:hypothetical protein
VINFLTSIWVLPRKRLPVWKVINNYFTSGAIDRDEFGNHNYRTGLNFGFKSNNGLEIKLKLFQARWVVEDWYMIWLWGWFEPFLYAIDYTRVGKKWGALHCFIKKK